MLGLWEEAALRRRTGLRGGKPVYGESEIRFACRVEPVRQVSAAGQRQDGACTVRIFARDVGAAPGDRVTFADGSAAILSEVARFPGPGGVHHVEMVALGEGGGHG